jgi:cyanophycin synthetase
MLPFDRRIVGGFLGRIAGDIIRFTAPYYIMFFSLFKLVGLNDDTEKASTLRSKVIWEEARKRKIPMRQVTILGKPIDIYLARVNGKKKIFESIPMRKNTSGSDLWMDDKYELKKKFSKEGIAVPQGQSVHSWRAALLAFHRLQKPVIVKPRLGSRGRHTTTHIYTEEELKVAYESAKKLCRFVIVEEQLFGSVYRGTLVDGKVVGILRGDPPRILGNGVQSIKELIDIKNKNRQSGIGAVNVTTELEDFILRQGYRLTDILPEFKILDLSEKIGLSYGGDAIELFPHVHQELIKELERAGAVVNASVIGFDFIIPDTQKDPNVQHWGIIECNSLPFINLHHFPREGTPINVASHVWDLWKK